VQVERRRRRAPEVDLESGWKRAPKKPEADDVVHVEMGEQDVDPGGVGAEVGQAVDAGAGVEHDVRPVPSRSDTPRRVAPYRVVPGRGLGSDPRVPQKVSFTASPVFLLFPEDRHRPEENAPLAIEGNGGGHYGVGGAVGAVDDHPRLLGTAFMKGHGDGHVLRPHGRPVRSARVEELVETG